MAIETKKKDVRIGFNKLKKQLPHRYTTAIAETLTDITPRQVKCVFDGEIKNPVIVKKVYDAALLVAEAYKPVRRISKKKVLPKQKSSVN